VKITKLISYLTVIVLAVSTTTITAIAEDSDVTDITFPIDHYTNYDFSNVQPTSTYEYPLTADMFTWFGAPGGVGEPVTRSQLRNADISVKYSTSQSKVLKDVTLSTTIYNGAKTACVKLEFADEFVSVKSLDFRLTIFLTINSSRNAASSVTINGTFENEEIEIDSSYDYVSLADGQVLKSKDYIAELEIDLGDDVQIFTRVQSDKKYYAKAKNVLLDEDDKMLTKYPKIETAIRIRSVNLKPIGNCVSLRDIGLYHAYTSSGKYLGTTERRLPFSDLYYLASDKITISGADNSDNSGSSGSSVGAISGNTPEEKAAKNEMTGAAEEAITSGSASANVSVKDLEKISTGELQAMFDAASLAKLKAKYTADTMNAAGTAAQGRITLNPALAAKLEGDIMLGVYTGNSHTFETKEYFERHYSNNLGVVYLAHEGSYGMTVSIAARLNTSEMDRKNLYFYCYDKRKNSYMRIANPNYYVDKNGYLHFNTIYGGFIIVSEGPLTKQKETSN